MEERLRQLYEEYSEQLLKFSLNDKEKIAYITGAQEALEFVAKNEGIKLEYKNIKTLADEISKMCYA